MKKAVTIEEYQQLCDQMRCDTQTRNSLLTFSFTAVLTALGIGFAMESDNTNVYVFLLPFFIIIPFTGRMAYYRIWSAQIKEYLCLYAEELSTYPIIGRSVPIEHGVMGTILAILVNYEMFFLACATTLLFFLKYPVKFVDFVVRDWCICSLPIILTFITFFIITAVYDYKKLRKYYKSKWEETLK